MTKIFLDSGDPQETRSVLKFLSELAGQTTNPSLIAKNPQAQGRRFSEAEIYDFYRGVVKEVSGLLPQGSVSVEVYADAQTSAEAMLKQAREFNDWIPNAHIKFPTTAEGLKAAEICIKEGIAVNMTLVFSQSQAAAVYAATQGAKKGQVFVSPFVGRLDDRGENGMDLIAHILRMYAQGDGHVEVLAASVRSQDHFLQALKLGSDIITAPAKILAEWAQGGQSQPQAEFVYAPAGLKSIPYEEISLEQPWTAYNISHELTDKGLAKFAADWNALIKN
ncbi:MAG TPA: transaldolase family protein [Patescibacteria group bacterium]|nr:transaldolase family protein [Patescibacteria group bacterium]